MWSSLSPHGVHVRVGWIGDQRCVGYTVTKHPHICTHTHQHTHTAGFQIPRDFDKVCFLLLQIRDAQPPKDNALTLCEYLDLSALYLRYHYHHHHTTITTITRTHVLISPVPCINRCCETNDSTSLTLLLQQHLDSLNDASDFVTPTNCGSSQRRPNADGASIALTMEFGLNPMDIGTLTDLTVSHPASKNNMVDRLRPGTAHLYTPHVPMHRTSTTHHGTVIHNTKST